MNRYIIFFVILLVSFIVVSVNAEDFKEEKYVQITKQDFKEYLENDKIIEVYQTNEGGILGNYIDDEGNKIEFSIQQWGHSNPFIEDAVERRGLSFKRKPLKKNYEYRRSPYEYVPHLLIGIFIALFIANIYTAIKINKIHKQLTKNNKGKTQHLTRPEELRGPSV